MKKETTAKKILALAKKLGMKPHSIVNNSVLYYDGGRTLGAESKPKLLEKLQAMQLEKQS